MIAVLFGTWERREGVILALVGLFFLMQFLAMSGWTIDDSYISYRYAWNLASGDGLTFNPGEWVEGYSNPLWVLLLAGPALVGIPPHWTGKLLGLAAGLGGLVYAWWFLRRILEVSLLTTTAALAWLATSTAWGLYTASGMETPLFGLTIVAMCAHLGARQWWPAAAWCAAASLTRPEGLLYTGPFVLVLLLDPQGPLRGGRRRDLLALAVPAGSIFGWRLLRLVLYGSSVPNTWHAKNYGRRDLFERLEHNWPGAWDGLWGGGEVLLAGGLGFALVVIGVLLAMRRTRTWALAAVPLCLFTFLVVGGSDWMSLARFLVPGLPAIAVLMFYALGQLDRDTLPFGGVAVWGVAAAMIGVQLHQATEVFVDLPRGVHHNPAMDARGHAALGRYLATRIEPGDDEILLNEIGAVGYFSEGTIVDTLGLVHAEVPHLYKRDANSVTQYFMGKYPRFVALHSQRSRRKKQMYPRDARFLKWMDRSGMYKEEARFSLSSWRDYRVWRRVLPEPAPGQGLRGSYGPAEPRLERIDGLVHFDWERGAPAEGLPKNGFDVVWTGCVQVPSRRRIWTLSDGTAELRLGGRVIGRLAQVGQGQHAIELRYAHKGGDAHMSLAWAAKGEEAVAIPPDALSPGDCAR